MGRGRSGLRRGVVELLLAAIFVAVAIQTWAHLELSLDEGHLNTLFDLDRSNGVPDLASTFVLAAAAAGAAALVVPQRGARRSPGAALTCVLVLLTFADVLHDGAHPWRPLGAVVIGLACGAVALLTLVALGSSWTARAMLATAALALVGSFLVTGLDRLDQWFERERGDPVREYQIVTKEGLELLGWSLVALALWDEALRRRRVPQSVTARASRAPAPQTRRVA